MGKNKTAKALEKSAAAYAAAPDREAAVVGDGDFWTATHIAQLADGITQQLGDEQNLRARTLFVALDDTRFLPVRVFPYLVVARRALVGMGMMMVASLAPIEGTSSVNYKFEIARPAAADAPRLVEIWSVRVGDSVVARFLLAPTDALATDLVREDRVVAAYSLKIESKE